MIMDEQLMLSEEQSLGASGTTESENVIDLGQVCDCVGALQNDRVNVSNRLMLNVVAVNESIKAGSAGTLTLNLHNDIDDNPVVGGDVIISKVIVTDASTTLLPAGTQLLSIALPMGQLKRYIKLAAVVAGSNLTDGMITAWIGTGMQQGGKIGQL